MEMCAIIGVPSESEQVNFAGRYADVTASVESESKERRQGESMCFSCITLHRVSSNGRPVTYDLQLSPMYCGR